MTPADHRNYWNRFYAGNEHQLVPDEPTNFAKWVSERVPIGEAIWEFGFGTARDTLWLAALGYRLRGFDFAEQAVSMARRAATARGSNAEFAILDLEDSKQVETMAREPTGGQAQVNIYGRFLLHSITDLARNNLWSLIATLGAEVKLFLEFRTAADADESHVFGDDHFRRYLTLEAVVGEVIAHGGAIVEAVEGRGLAPYKTEDPVVARISAAWPKPGRVLFSRSHLSG